MREPAQPIRDRARRGHPAQPAESWTSGSPTRYTRGAIGDTGRAGGHSGGAARARRTTSAQELVLESLARLDVPRLTLDVDGTVVFVKPWGARRRSRRWKKLSSAFAASETAVSTRQPQPSRLLWVSIAAGAARRPPWTLCQANAIVDPLPKVKLTPLVFGSVLFTRRLSRKISTKSALLPRFGR